MVGRNTFEVFQRVPTPSRVEPLAQVGLIDLTLGNPALQPDDRFDVAIAREARGNRLRDECRARAGCSGCLFLQMLLPMKELGLKLGGRGGSNR